MEISTTRYFQPDDDKQGKKITNNVNAYVIVGKYPAR